MDPQPNEVPPQNSVPQSPVVKKSFPPYLLLILLLATFAGGILTSLAMTGYFAKKEDTNGPKTLVKQSDIVSANPDEIEGNEDIYAALILDNTTGMMKEDTKKAIYGVRSSGKVDVLLPLTDEMYVKHAWFAGGFAYAYEECNAMTATVCTIKKQSFVDGKTEDVLTLKQTAPYTDAGVLEGAFSLEGHMFAYLWQRGNATHDPQKPEEIVLSIYDRLLDKTIEVFAVKTSPNGRGGSADDDRSIVFSPDGTKLFVTMTGLYPISTLEGVTDVGTSFLFDIPQRRLVFSKPIAFTTFGRFIDNRYALVKDMRRKIEETKSVPTLVRIDTSTGAAEDIGYVGGYQMMPIDSRTVLMMIIGATPQSGVSFGSYQIDAKKFDLITPNVVPLKLGRLFGVLSSTVPCFAGPSTDENFECSAEIYNGVSTVGGKLMLYDVTTKKSQVLPLPEFNTYSVQAVR